MMVATDPHAIQKRHHRKTDTAETAGTYTAQWHNCRLVSTCTCGWGLRALIETHSQHAVEAHNEDERAEEVF